MPQTGSQSDTCTIRWTAIEVLPTENGLPVVVLPEPNPETRYFREHSLLVLCIQGREQSWFANLGKSVFVETLRWQRRHLVQPSLVSKILYILGKYIQRAVLLAYRIYLSHFSSLAEAQQSTTDDRLNQPPSQA